MPALKQYVSATFDVVYESPQSYYFLLSFGDLCFTYPDPFNQCRDEARIADRMEEIRTEIAPFLTDPSWEVFAADEVRMQLTVLMRRAWLKRGERTVIRVNRKREAQNYLGLLNQKTFRCHDHNPIEHVWKAGKDVLANIQLRDLETVKFAFHSYVQEGDKIKLICRNLIALSMFQIGFPKRKANFRLT